jgi:primosomal protein N'
MPVHGTFTYRVPEELARLASTGTRVLVPFGRRRATGYVLGSAPPSDRADIKPIVDVLDERPVFPGAMIPFLRWTADYYKYPLGQVIETALPGGLTVSESAVFCATVVGRAAMGDATASATERRVLEVLAGDGLRTRGCARDSVEISPKRWCRLSAPRVGFARGPAAGRRGENPPGTRVRRLAGNMNVGLSAKKSDSRCVRKAGDLAVRS